MQEAESIFKFNLQHARPDRRWTKPITVAAPPSAVVYTVTKNLPDDMYQDTTYEMIITAENKAPIP
jgi:hypothetical protein